MDARFHPAIAAIRSGNLEELKSLLMQDPTLATGRSSTSHATLLQCLALDALDVPSKVEMARVLIEAGAEINGPFCACASIDNVEVAAALLDAGALVNGTGRWSPLEEALYWGNDAVRDFLLERGASIHNLRIAAALGRTDLIEGFFNRDGSLKPEAGEIEWPFGDPLTSNLARRVKEKLVATMDSWSDHAAQSVIDNAFVYACLHNRIDAARLLLQRGARINAIPAGFHYPGTALHNAALKGHRSMVEFLIENGADANARDGENGGSPSSWAAHDGHSELKEFLDEVAKSQNEARPTGLTP